MKSILLLIILSLVFLHNSSPAQWDTTLKKGWNPKGVIGVGLNQVALSNWVKGGENLIAIAGLTDFGLHYMKFPYLFKNRLTANIGSTKTGGGAFRTNENSLVLDQVLMRNIGWAVDPYISNNIRTGLLNGYDYKLEPAVQSSAFFDPGYITQSIGFTFVRPHFSTRLGLAFQETFTNKFRNYTDDQKTLDKREAFKFETGIESVTEGDLTVAENMIYTSRLRLFSAFETIDVWDVAWENTITAKVNDFFAANINLIVLYEKAESPKTQLKEGLTVGINYILF